jgi:hypothetical protein
MTEIKRYCQHCGAELEEWAAEQAKAAAEAKRRADAEAQAAAQAAAKQADRVNILEEITAPYDCFYYHDTVTVAKLCRDEGAYVTPKDKVLILKKQNIMGESSKTSVKPKTSGYIHYLCSQTTFFGFGNLVFYKSNDVLAEIRSTPK